MARVPRRVTRDTIESLLAPYLEDGKLALKVTITGAM